MAFDLGPAAEVLLEAVRFARRRLPAKALCPSEDQVGGPRGDVTRPIRANNSLNIAGVRVEHGGGIWYRFHSTSCDCS